MRKSGNAAPSRAWFILPSVLLLAGGLLAALGITSFVQIARPDLRSYRPDSPVSVTTDGFTLYAEDGTTGVAALSCTATGGRGPIRMPPVSGRTTLSNDQGRFVAIASTPTDLPAGRYVIACGNVPARPEVPLYLGPRIDLASIGRLAVFGIVAPLFLGISSVVLFAILTFLRYLTGRKSAAVG